MLNSTSRIGGIPGSSLEITLEILKHRQIMNRRNAKVRVMNGSQKPSPPCDSKNYVTFTHIQREVHNRTILSSTAVAHPQANGLVERANRSLMEGIKTRLGREKAGWVDELPNVLWAHRTSIKQSNGETPFSLTYGSEAVIPAEIGIPSYQTLMIREEFNEEEQRLNLDLLQE
ncbi:reverse transcriptase domain-containing protein [Tanacetum coccineum]